MTNAPQSELDPREPADDPRRSGQSLPDAQHLVPDAQHSLPDAQHEARREAGADTGAEGGGLALLRNVSFWGVTVTQFLGAFNDNVYKQLLLLLFVKVPEPGGGTRDLQWVALLMFSLPFVLFSGYAGYLSDRNSKRTVMKLCKLAEVAIMALAVLAFLGWGHWGWNLGIMTVLCLLLFGMGTHSAFFGPGKFGILPELFSGGDLPRANGIVLSSTFIAIILGGMLGSIFKETLGTELWIAGCVCVLIAVFGSISVLYVRPTPAMAPQLKFHISMLAIPEDIMHLLRRDRPLYRALVASSIFWLSAALVQPSIIALGKLQLQEGDIRTGYLVTVVSIGIAVGSALTGAISARGFGLLMQRLGAWGMVVTLASLAIPFGARQHLLGYWGSLAALTLLGVATGMFAVPLQVFVQSRPPEGQKGRMIATQNLMNWIGIFLSTGIYAVGNQLLVWLNLPGNGMFALTAVTMATVAIGFRPILPHAPNERPANDSGADP